ncbi:MAG: FAD-binding oxidoreductase [Candidatus Pacebacteria bacterium]|nr:FAD-binding oxidoreductase [Candidatus Paceibacterota bacterium]
MFEIIVDIIYTLGLTLGVGSSTFALIFYIRALEDGVVDPSEKRFMHTVYIVLRIGMVLIGIGLVGLLSTKSATLILQWILLIIITINAVLMAYRYMPMKYGPVIAGGSWYSLFLVSKTPIANFNAYWLLVCYASFLIFVYVVFQYLKSKFTIVKGTYGGDVVSDSTTLEQYSTDASSFKLLPQAVYYPKNVNDIVELTKMCKESRKTNPRASLTLRAGGTCMSGGPLNTGWIVDMTKHMNHISIDAKNMTATVEMGAYFRDIEDEAQKHGLMFAAYPSSHRICGIGGMLGNNASGEKSLRCGATSDNVLELEVVLADGTVERIAPKQISELTTDREKQLYAFYEKYGTKMRKATGSVKKSASGYRFEKLVHDTVFSAVPLFVGAQGTLGIITKATLKLTPIPKYTELLLIPASSLKDIPTTIDIIHHHNPEGLETFDRNTFAKAKEHLSEAVKRVEPYIQPKSHLVILAQFSERTEKATKDQANKCLETLIKRGFHAVHVTQKEDVQAVWEVRRNSFLLMRDYNETGRRAVPCIEDVIVPLPELGTFIIELREILKKRALNYGYHGHIGDGSLRVIPIFDFTKPTVGNEITELMNEVFALVKRLKGNISADHSDGIIRSPFLKDFYGEELYGVFAEIKRLYDPDNIMNPNKKLGGSIGFLNICLDCEKV